VDMQKSYLCCQSEGGRRARRKEQKLQRKGLKAMNSAETQREWMEQWCESGVWGNLNVTFATQEALIGSHEIVLRVKGFSAQGERKGLSGLAV